MSTTLPSDSLDLLPNGQRAIGTWLESVEENRSHETGLAYAKWMRKFASWAAEKGYTLASVTPTAVKEWRDQMISSYSVSTTRLALSAVRSFYEFAIDAEAIQKNPAGRVRVSGAKGHARRREELTDEEVRAVFATCSDSQTCRRDRAILSLMAYTGLQTVEIHRANWEDIKTKEGRYLLWVWARGRSEPDEYVVLPEAAEQALRDYLQDHPQPGGPLFISFSRTSYGHRLSKNYIRRMIARRYRHARVEPGKTASGLRHAAISNALRHGATPQQATRMARQTSIRAYYQNRGRINDPAEDKVNYEPDE